MQNASEIYFVAGMMVLILIICAVSVYAFVKTYKKEKAQREREKKHVERSKKQAEKTIEN